MGFPNRTEAPCTFPRLLFILTPFLLASCVQPKAPTQEEVRAERELDSLLDKHYNDSLDAYHAPDEFLGLVNKQWGDIDSMIARRYIRVVVPYSLTYYYVDGTTRKGIAFDAMKSFERGLNKDMKFDPPRVGVVFIPVNRERIIPMVSEGYADIGVGGFETTSKWADQVDYTEPTLSGLRHIVVGNKLSPPLNSLADLADKEIYVRRGSDFETSLAMVNDSLMKAGYKSIRIRQIDPYFEIEDVLQVLDAGIIPYAVSYERMARLWSDVLDSLQLYPNVTLKENIDLHWVVRKNSPKFKARVDKFVAENHVGTRMGNIWYKRYMTPQRLKHVQSAKSRKQFETLAALFRKYGGQYSLDWILLAAQGYQESRLDQKAVSPVGAVGIMQVMPFVAKSKQVNIPNIYTTENNIHAGAKVMRHLMDVYFKDIEGDSLNRQLIALAAYNCGPTRMSRLRKEATARGLNPNVWFDNVENVVAHRVGRETVTYVSNVYKYYTSFRALNLYSESKREHATAGE
jgi:membrane-bound lytic murein transglycosylase MltF